MYHALRVLISFWHVSKFSSNVRWKFPNHKTNIGRRKTSLITSGIISSIKTKDKLYKGDLKTPTQTIRPTTITVPRLIILCAERRVCTIVIYLTDLNMKWNEHGKIFNEILHKGRSQYSYHDTLINGDTKISVPKITQSTHLQNKGI